MGNNTLLKYKLEKNGPSRLAMYLLLLHAGKNKMFHYNSKLLQEIKRPNCTENRPIVIIQLKELNSINFNRFTLSMITVGYGHM